MLIFILATITILYASIGMAFLSRMDGGGWPTTPEAVERLLCISPYIILGFAIHPIAGLLNLAAYGGLATGHGQYFMDVEGKMINPDRVEFVDFIVRLFYGKDPRVQPVGTGVDDYNAAILGYGGYDKIRQRCILGLSLTGLLVTIVPTLTAAFFGHFLIALLLLTSGLAKGAVYYAVHRLKAGTEYSELGNGFQRGIFAFTSIAILLASYIM